MQIAVISTILAIVFFYVLYLGFKQGLRLGMTVAKGETPEPIKGPVQAIKEHRQATHLKKEMEKEAEQWQEIDQYDGWTEEERKMNSRGVNG